MVHPRSLQLAVSVGILMLGSQPTRLMAVEIDSAMLVEPVLEPVPEVSVFSSKLKPLWLAALKQPETDLKRQAAEAIAKATRLDMPGLDDLIEPLVHEMEADQTHLVARLPIARALIALNARSEAATLAGYAQSDGLEMAQIVEPALAHWDYLPQRDVWLERLKNPTAPARRLILAVEALGQVREPAAAPRLGQLAMDQSQRADIRMEAARSLSLIGRDDLADLASQLLSAPHDEQLINRLVAAQLLTVDVGSRAIPILRRLAVDSEPAVAVIALEVIQKLDPKLIAEWNQQLVSSSDTNIRRVTTDLLLAQQTPEAVELLGSLLADPHPDLRSKACDALVQLATIEQLDSIVRQVIVQTLESPQPEAVRQAVLAVGALQHYPSAERLVALLDAPQSDVYIAAAWALRRLADPATGPAIMEKIGRETRRRLALVKQLAPIVAANPYAEPEFPPVDDSNAQLEQLIQALGVMRLEAAEPLFREFLPKPPRPQIGDPPVLETERQVVLRAAAFWALGIYHGPSAPDPLRELLRARLDDTYPKHPEHPLVRRMSAITLARMHDLNSVDMMRPLCEPPKAYTELGRACRWAMHEITGEVLSELPAIPRTKSDWFLVPLNL